MKASRARARLLMITFVVCLQEISCVDPFCLKYYCFVSNAQVLKQNLTMVQFIRFCPVANR